MGRPRSNDRSWNEQTDPYHDFDLISTLPWIPCLLKRKPGSHSEKRLFMDLWDTVLEICTEILRGRLKPTQAGECVADMTVGRSYEIMMEDILSKRNKEVIRYLDKTLGR
jgi:hypothetical protein